ALMDLFRPALKHSDWKVRKAAIERCVDQAALAEIAKTDSNADLRRAAIDRLQAVLAEIAKNGSDWEVRMAAAAKLTDQVLAQAVYAAVAKNDRLKILDLRKEAVGQLTD